MEPLSDHLYATQAYANADAKAKADAKARVLLPIIQPLIMGKIYTTCWLDRYNFSTFPDELVRALSYKPDPNHFPVLDPKLSHLKELSSQEICDMSVALLSRGEPMIQLFKERQFQDNLYMLLGTEYLDQLNAAFPISIEEIYIMANINEYIIKLRKRDQGLYYFNSNIKILEIDEYRKNAYDLLRVKFQQEHIDKKPILLNHLRGVLLELSNSFVIEIIYAIHTIYQMNNKMN